MKMVCIILCLHKYCISFRSMPTSAALDVVAQNLNLKFFEVPAGAERFSFMVLYSSYASVMYLCSTECFFLGIRFPLGGSFLGI